MVQTQTAALCNLVLVTEKNDRSSYMSGILHGAFRLFPAKILLFFLCDDLNEMRIERTTVPMDPNNPTLLCEKIEYHVPKKQKERIYFSLCKDLQSDRECYLVWGDTTLSLEEMNQIARLADKVIFDSELAPNLVQFATEALSFHEHLNLDIADLNWSRILSWRTLLFNYFNDPATSTHLAHLKHIEIFYNQMQSPIFCHTQAQSLYFAFWIAQSLHLPFVEMKKEGDALILYFDHTGEKIAFEVKPLQNTLVNAGKILGIKLHLDHEMTISMVRNEKNPKELLIDASDLTRCSLQEHIDFSKEGTSYAIISDLAHIRGNQLFLSILQTIKTLPPEKCP